jgi:hypothetical protein
MTDYIWSWHPDNGTAAEGALVPCEDILQWNEGDTLKAALERAGYYEHHEHYGDEYGWEIHIDPAKSDGPAEDSLAEVSDGTTWMLVRLPDLLSKLSFLAYYVPIIERLNAAADADAEESVEKMLYNHGLRRNEHSGLRVEYPGGGTESLEGDWKATPYGILQLQRFSAAGYTRQEFIPWAAITQITVTGHDPRIEASEKRIAARTKAVQG